MSLEHRSNFFLIDKPKDFTSQDVCTIIKKKYGYNKVGHSGTLDPLATGLLILATDSYTKLLSYIIEMEKTYDFTVHFGYTSESGDLGTDLVKRDPNYIVNIKDLNNVLNKFIGYTEQVPPMYSAIKVQGKRLYDYARNDEIVDLPKRNIHIENLKINEIINDSKVNFSVTCSKGTYIRSLARDIGEILGVGGVIEDLRRTKIASISVEEAIDISNLPDYDKFELLAYECNKLINITNVEIDNTNIKTIKNGGFLPASLFSKQEECFIVTIDNRIVALYEEYDEMYYKPRKVLI